MALFGGKAGFEEGGIGIADANNMPVACYLARGKIPRNMDASHRDVDPVCIGKINTCAEDLRAAWLSAFIFSLQFAVDLIYWLYQEKRCL